VTEDTEPLVTTTDRCVSVEWHAHGLNIEMRMQQDYMWVLIEDARGEVPEFRGRGTIAQVLHAVSVMEARAAA
jgi:hypothetical protein